MPCRGALRAERKELLTVVLPQSLEKQSEASRELIQKVCKMVDAGVITPMAGIWYPLLAAATRGVLEFAASNTALVLPLVMLVFAPPNPPRPWSRHSYKYPPRRCLSVLIRSTRDLFRMSLPCACQSCYSTLLRMLLRAERNSLN